MVLGMADGKPRRTQAERSAATRERILDATAQTLLELGYQGTTISQVQERAGLARAGVQHHFPTRQELISAVATHVIETRLGQFRRDAALIAPETDRLTALVDLAWRDLNSREFFTALELWVAARTDADLRERLLHEEARLFAGMRRIYAALLTDDQPDPPSAEVAGELADFTIQLLTGLSITTMLTGQLGSREITIRRWKQALQVLAAPTAAR